MKTLFSLFLIYALALPAWGARALGPAENEGHTADSVALTTDSLATKTDSTALAADTLEASVTSTPDLAERLRRLLDDRLFERTQVGLYVYDLTADSLIFAHHEQQSMRPASNEKLVTAITALSVLGGGHLFRTTFLADRAIADSDSFYVGHLYVHGGYDPLLDGDDLRAFARLLKERGVRALGSSVRLDLSFKDTKRLGWGWCWDDKDTPTTPLLYRNEDTFARHLRDVLRNEGIAWDGTTEEAVAPASAEVLLERTHTIDQVLLPMMKESDNSMAEATFYQLAASDGHAWADRHRAARHIDRLVRHVGLDSERYTFADGSGLSLYNYASPELLGRLLRYAYANDSIYRHLLPSLPIAGHDGTLRKRMRHTSADGNVRAKTGTVTGVSNLSGYLTTAEGHTLCFSIMNQGLRTAAEGRRFQDRVCVALTK